MASIEERILSMKMDDKSLQTNGASALGMLQKLQAALKLTGGAKGLEDVDKAAKGLNSGALSSIADGVNTISSRFSAFGIMAVTALTQISSAAVSTGAQLLKSLTLDPILQGFQEYELKMGSIQTILANTARYGTGLDQVNASLDELNTYADKTIYNFGDMTRNIGLFTNAGIGVEDATSMIKGFSNAAAASGTSAQGAAGAAYQLSQALSAGTIRLMDWRSLTNVGMGNKNMQDDLIQIASAMGTFNAKTTTAEAATKDFNGSLEKGWLSADVMSNYLQIMAGDMDDASMSALGLSDTQIEAFKKTQQTAEEAATKVRTFTQLIGTLREAVGSGWSETFGILIGDFNEATDLWTAVNDRLSGMVGQMSDARNQLLNEWKDLGGRDVAIEGLGNIFEGLLSVLKPIGQAFRDIFPAATAQQLYDLTVKFRDFTENLILSDTTAKNLRRTFDGVFAIFSIVGQVVSAVVSVLASLVGVTISGSGGFLAFTARIGDWLKTLSEAIKTSGIFKTAAEGIVTVVQNLISFFSQLIHGVDDVSESFDGAASAGEKLSAFFKAVGDAIKAVVDQIGEGLSRIQGPLQAFGKFISDIFDKITTSLGNFAKTVTLEDIFKGLVAGSAVGMLTSIWVCLKNIVGLSNKPTKLFDVLKEFVSDTGKGITDILDGISGSVKAMERDVNASALLKIAAAMLVLAAAVLIMSTIDPAQLAATMGAITVLFGELIGSLAGFSKVLGVKTALKFTLIAAGLILLSIAMLILAGAVKSLAELDWEELAKGLSGVIVLIAALVGALKLMGDDSGMSIRGAIGILILAAAIKVLASAVKDLSGLSWEELAKGIASVIVVLGALALFMKFAKFDQMGITTGISILLLAVAIKVLATAVKDLAELDIGSLAKGLVAVGVLLGEIALFTRAAASPGQLLATALGLLVISAALKIISGVLQDLGGMTWEEVAKGLITLAGALLIIGVAVNSMQNSLSGAAALLIVAVALAVLGNVLQAFGNMSWEEIIKGLVMLAGVFLILGVSATVLTPLTPVLLALGAAILLMGLGALAAGVGMMAFAAGITALAGAAGAIFGVITAIVGAVAVMIPFVMAQLAQGIIDFAQVISTGGPQFTAAMVTLILALVDAINQTAPEVIITLATLVVLLLEVLAQAVPQMVDAGMRMLQGVLEGIANNIGGVTDAAISIITNFIDAIAARLPDIAESGVNLLISFVNAITGAVDSHSAELGAAGGRLAVALVKGMVNGITAGISEVATAITDLASKAVQAGKDALGIHSPSKKFFYLGQMSGEGMVNGLKSMFGAAKSASEDLSEVILDGADSDDPKLKNPFGFDDSNPKITPVVDLSEVKKGASDIAKIFGDQPNITTVSARQASKISESRALDSSTVGSGSQTSVSNNINYTQNNYSPKALSRLEIYRNTRNQLQTLKGVS